MCCWRIGSKVPDRLFKHYRVANRHTNTHVLSYFRHITQKKPVCAHAEVEPNKDVSFDHPWPPKVVLKNRHAMSISSSPLISLMSKRQDIVNIVVRSDIRSRCEVVFLKAGVPCSFYFIFNFHGC